MSNLEILAVQTGTALRTRGWLLAGAESCTGGWVAQVVTSVPGSSAWFERGFVTYTNTAKQEMLGVRAETLAAHGAVSEAVVLEMARGALQHGHAHISLAISGIAGPDGGTPDKPVGTVWLAWVWPAGERARCEVFQGDRQAVRAQAVSAALQGVIDIASLEPVTAFA